MAALVLPGHTAPTLAITATATAVNIVRRIVIKKRDPTPSLNSDANSSALTEPVTLKWSNVTCTLTKRKHEPPQNLLKNISGVARPGRILAIMGPSGSGKTTLLNSLTGRVAVSKNIDLYGSVTANGVSIDETTVPIAYVSQDDLFFTQLTVRETLDMAAQLRLPRTVTKEERKQFVDNLIRKLGLVSAQNTRVGDAKTRGISGGEKKRLSLGCELISTPRLIICDEPTSGLDAFQAENVMTTLRILAEAGHTVICSIHQPSSTIVKLCDDLVLLAGGQQVYAGSTNDAPAHFAKAGFPMPEFCNPAERYLDLISIDYSSDATMQESQARIEKLVVAGRDRPSKMDSEVNGALKPSDIVTPTSSPHNRVGPLAHVRVLFVRAWRQVIRDNKTNISRLVSSLSSALLFGAIYWKIGFSQTTIQDRLGLLQVCTINGAMSALVKTLNVFPRESVIINRERIRGCYNVLEYFTSKLFAEMPVSAFFPLIFSVTVYPMVRLSGGVGRVARFLGLITLESFTAASYGLAIGALLPSTEAALAIGPASFVLQIVFGGLYITEKNVPRWARWVPRISLIKHAYEGLCVNEFRGIKFETKRIWDVRDGEQVLQRLEWDNSTVMKTCISQSRVLLFNYLFTYALLSLKKPRFAKLKPAVIRELTDDEASPRVRDEGSHSAVA